MQPVAARPALPSHEGGLNPPHAMATPSMSLNHTCGSSSSGVPWFASHCASQPAGTRSPLRIAPFHWLTPTLCRPRGAGGRLVDARPACCLALGTNPCTLMLLPRRHPCNACANARPLVHARLTPRANKHARHCMLLTRRDDGRQVRLLLSSCVACSLNVGTNLITVSLVNGDLRKMQEAAECAPRGERLSWLTHVEVSPNPLLAADTKCLLLMPSAGCC